MELNDYQRKAMSFCEGESDSYSYMSAGLTEEVGELLGKVAKPIRKREMIVKDNQIMFTEETLLDRRNEIAEDIKKELGDVLWMVSGMARVFGFTLEDIGSYNIEKLTSRKNRGVIIGSGDNR